MCSQLTLTHSLLYLLSDTDITTWMFRVISLCPKNNHGHTPSTGASLGGSSTTSNIAGILPSYGKIGSGLDLSVRQMQVFNIQYIYIHTVGWCLLERPSWELSCHALCCHLPRDHLPLLLRRFNGPILQIGKGRAASIHGISSLFWRPLQYIAKSTEIRTYPRISESRKTTRSGPKVCVG